MKGDLYLLIIVDSYDDGLIKLLIYDNVDDFVKAKELVEKSKQEWYEKDIDYCLKEYLEEKLEENNLTGRNSWCCEKVRV